ncbi:MAG: hypothetical protein L0Y35_01320, partial [Flammeovirgaceae bacterium]|nr:hypothetical protein [Flammeovirgaceae bacterium]
RVLASQAQGHRRKNKTRGSKGPFLIFKKRVNRHVAFGGEFKYLPIKVTDEFWLAILTALN